MARKRKTRRFVVSVQDFGARGDGFADDSAAFMAAGRTHALVIKVPPGVYCIGAEVQIDHRFVGIGERRDK